MKIKLKNFETDWSKHCKDIETIELSQRDAEIKKLDFEIEANILRAASTTYDLEEFERCVNNIRRDVSIALERARLNYRNNESKRLKKTWGKTAGGFVYLIKTLLGKV